MSGWQAVYEQLDDDGFVIIAAAQDTGGEAAAGTWYDQAKASYVTLVDPNHTISSLYNLVNVPSAVWIDEQGKVLRIDEGTYATTHKMGEFEFGRDDYAPMVVDWVEKGANSAFVTNAAPIAERLKPRSSDQARAEPTFKLGVYFYEHGDQAKADVYWQKAQALNPDSWNYARQDWSFTPEQAGANWQQKFETLQGKPYYKPVAGLDTEG